MLVTALTLAIIKALLFRVEQRLYAVPLNAVSEITRAHESDLQAVDPIVERLPEAGFLEDRADPRRSSPGEPLGWVAAVGPGAVVAAGTYVLLSRRTFKQLEAIFEAAVALDPAGNIYVADRGNNTLRRITLNGEVSTVAGPAQGDATSGFDVSLDYPSGIAVDRQGSIYVADTQNEVIRWILLASEAPRLQVQPACWRVRPGMTRSPIPRV